LAFLRTKFHFGLLHVLNVFLRPLQRFNVRQAKTRPRFLPLGYSSLLGQCLRLVSYATGALPHLRLRAFHGRSSLPSLCYRIAGNSVAALSCETSAATASSGRGDFTRCRLLALLSLTKRR